MDTVTLLFLSVLPAIAIAAALKDVTTMTIPNWMSAALIVLFFPTAWLVGLPFQQVLIHLGVAFVALLVGMGMFALRWLGGGDAKLMASTVLWLGLSGGGMFLLWTGVCGGLFCLSLIYARFHARPYVAGAPQWLGRLLEPKGDIPYGVAIAAGALIAYPASPLIETFIRGV